MTSFLIWSCVVVTAWVLMRAFRWLAAIGAKRSRTPVEVWRVPFAPSVCICGVRAWSASGAELITVGVYSIAALPAGEQVTLLQEIATLEPGAAEVARTVMLQALNNRSLVGGLH
ncbi:MAG TPA: hypothetical protein PKA66_07370 [Gemmatimonadales bacterium]|nr:hypothetical protein [Gemmatimonadales bacterium]